MRGERLESPSFYRLFSSGSRNLMDLMDLWVMMLLLERAEGAFSLRSRVTGWCM